MPRLIVRFGIWLCAGVLALPLYGSVAHGADKKPYLEGRLLVASPNLRDPNFIHSVVYMVRHDATGATGLIINRRIGSGDLADLLRGFNLSTDDKTRRVDLHFGGPVASGSVFILHSPDYEGDGTETAPGGFAMTGDRSILGAIAEGRGPERMKFMVGYSGWGPGQLEGEFDRGDWLDAPADENSVFAGQGSAEEQWQQARDKAGLTL